MVVAAGAGSQAALSDIGVVAAELRISERPAAVQHCGPPGSGLCSDVWRRAFTSRAFAASAALRSFAQQEQQ